MPQILRKKGQEFSYEKTWVETVSGVHIGKLTNGGYFHVAGVPVRSKAELDVIPQGEDRVAAYQWWDHKDDVKEVPKRKIVIQLNGDYTFDDNSPINSMEELVNNIARGPALDAAIRWLAKKMDVADATKVVIAEENAEKTKQAIWDEQNKKELQSLLLPNRQCAFIMESGKQCSRKALDGSKYCGLRFHCADPPIKKDEAE